MAEATDFKFGTQPGFAKAHYKITHIGKSRHGLGLGELPNLLWFHFNIYTMAEARDFKFRKQLGFAKAHHKTTPRGKVDVAFGYGSSHIFGVPFNISATAALSSYGSFLFTSRRYIWKTVRDRA